MDLLDLMDEEGWIELEKEIHESFGGNVAVSRLDGSKLTGFVAWANKVCPLIKSNKQSLSAICSIASQNSIAEVRETGKSAIINCDAGFCRICSPIQVNGELIGVLGVCGLLLDEDVESFYIAKLTGLAEEEIEALAESAQQITEQESLKLVEYLEEKIDQITSKAKN